MRCHGAGSGIGLGITRQLLARGATVYMVGRTEKKSWKPGNLCPNTATKSTPSR